MKGLVIYQQLIPAWLEGKKTVTRRLMNPQPGEDLEGPCQSGLDGRWMFCRNNPPNELTPIYIKLPYCPGETVYIKETWSTKHMITDYVLYKAGWESAPRFKPQATVKWQSPRLMPEWAARSHALIKSVRPERVQDITEEEALKEGIIQRCYEEEERYGEDLLDITAVNAFYNLWESLHSGSWNRNDWVWRIEPEKQ